LHLVVIELENLGAKVFKDTLKLGIDNAPHLLAVSIVKQAKLHAYVLDDPLFRLDDELPDGDKKLLDQRDDELISTQKVRQSVKDKFCN